LCENNLELVSTKIHLSPKSVTLHGLKSSKRGGNAYPPRRKVAGKRKRGRKKVEAVRRGASVDMV